MLRFFGQKNTKRIKTMNIRLHTITTESGYYTVLSNVVLILFQSSFIVFVYSDFQGFNLFNPIHTI